jgi:hypothetical protein
MTPPPAVIVVSNISWLQAIRPLAGPAMSSQVARTPIRGRSVRSTVFGAGCARRAEFVPDGPRSPHVGAAGRLSNSPSPGQPPVVWLSDLRASLYRHTQRSKRIAEPNVGLFGLPEGREGTRNETAAPAGRRQAQTRLDAAAVDKLVTGYQAGATVPELARIFRVHRTTVLAHLERHGVPRRANRRKLTDAQVQEASQLYSSGLSLTAVGKQLAVDEATIRTEFHKAGIPTRPGKGGPIRRQPRTTV